MSVYWRGCGFEPRQIQHVFLFCATSRLVVGPTDPPVQLLPGVLSPEVKRLGLATPLRLVRRQRMRVVILALLPTAPQLTQGQV